MSQRSRAEAENKAAESAGEKASVRGKYRRPDLNRSEWNLLNRRLEEEIESSGQYLDESTKWLYADEKGVQVFALYGIGDGTEATPLYAVGGKKHSKPMNFLRVKWRSWIMKLRGTEKTLADGLAAFGATKSMTAMILTLLAEQEQLQMELINYMVGHQTATPRELLEKAIEMVR